MLCERAMPGRSRRTVVAALAPAAVLLAKPLPADVAGVLELAAVRPSFLNDGVNRAVAAAAALLKAWAASKPDAAQARPRALYCRVADAGLLNAVAAYLPPRGDAVLGVSGGVRGGGLAAAKASTGDAALDKLATLLLIRQG